VDDYTDAWFVGFTPHLATSVWVGYPDAKIPMWGMTGGSTPAGIWHDYMVTAVGNDCADFKPPKQQAKFSPFFGQYARTGSRYDTDYSYRRYRPDYRYRDSQEPDDGSLGRSGGGRYNPEYYESPPQQAPRPGGGGGGGEDGGGRGQGDGGRGQQGGDGGGGGQGGGTSAGGAQAPG
jgi:penicillin-binding protein 1A